MFDAVPSAPGVYVKSIIFPEIVNVCMSFQSYPKLKPDTDSILTPFNVIMLPAQFFSSPVRALTVIVQPELASTFEESLAMKFTNAEQTYPCASFITVMLNSWSYSWFTGMSTFLPSQYSSAKFQCTPGISML